MPHWDRRGPLAPVRSGARGRTAYARAAARRDKRDRQPCRHRDNQGLPDPRQRLTPGDTMQSPVSPRSTHPGRGSAADPRDGTTPGHAGNAVPARCRPGITPVPGGVRAGPRLPRQTTECSGGRPPRPGPTDRPTTCRVALPQPAIAGRPLLATMSKSHRPAAPERELYNINSPRPGHRAVSPFSRTQVGEGSSSRQRP
jgi:hypothetical protein